MLRKERLKRLDHIISSDVLIDLSRRQPFTELSPENVEMMYAAAELFFRTV